jgi:hypothetical protein
MSNSYVWVSAAIGLAQVADAAMYLRLQGRASLTGWVFSLVEFLWGAVSIYVLLQADTGVPKWLPLMFVVYLAVWTAYGVRTAERHTDLKNIKLTPNEVLVSGAFGLVFATASLAAAL